MHRRDFLLKSTGVVAGTLAITDSASGKTLSDSQERFYHICGVPLRSGSLVPGNENDAQAYRDAHLLGRLRATGCKVSDDGDVPLPSYLPHHFVPPIRNWPGPRIVWDIVSAHVRPLLHQPSHIPLLIGCDCSVVIGTAQAVAAESSDIHVLYIDGDFDDAAPDATECHSAAACAVWLLTRASPFWVGSALSPSQVTVVGWSRASQTKPNPLQSISLAELRATGIAHRLQKFLETISPSTSILVHFDTDVLQKAEFPAAYFPHDEGMTFSEMTELLRAVMQDRRVRLLEVSEYASLRDLGGTYASRLADLLCAALKP